MKTKIVYSCSSSSADVYLEQTLVSVYSLKIYNSQAHTVLVIDSQTNETINEHPRRKIRDYFDEVIVVDCPEGYNQHQRSRFLKTNIRQVVSGDYLFIDSDTIVASSLEEIDYCTFEVGAVGDKHVIIKNHAKRELIKLLSKKVGWQFNEQSYYYNSGVMYVKDTPRAHELYKLWHNEWIKYHKIVGQDQPSLAKADAMMGGIIETLDGTWNCQISDNGLKYLYKAKIVHYFSSTIHGKDSGNPFLFHSNNLYIRMKNDYDIPEDLKAMVTDVKSQFSDHAKLFSPAYTDLIDTAIFNNIFILKNNYPLVFKSLEKIFKLFDKARKYL